MTRILLALAGVVLLAVTALGLIWLAGELLMGVGVLAVGTAGMLLKLLWFLTVAGLLGGMVYFVSNAWRPTPPAHAERRVRLEPAVQAAGAHKAETKQPENDLRIGALAEPVGAKHDES